MDDCDVFMASAVDLVPVFEVYAHVAGQAAACRYPLSLLLFALIRTYTGYLPCIYMQG